MFAIWSPQPNWIPKKPKLMFQICQKLNCGGFCIADSHGHSNTLSHTAQAYSARFQLTIHGTLVHCRAESDAHHLPIAVSLLPWTVSLVERKSRSHGQRFD